MRFSLAEVDRSAGAIFTMGLLLEFWYISHHVLPNLTGLHIILRQPRSAEDELMEAGKLESRMPAIGF